jgi:hypothetical protein
MNQGGFQEIHESTILEENENFQITNRASDIVNALTKHKSDNRDNKDNKDQKKPYSNHAANAS